MSDSELESHTKTNTIICLNAEDLNQLGLTMPAIVELLSTMFRERATEIMVNPPKIFEHRSEDRFYSSMVSFAPNIGFASCKWQSGDAKNPDRGLPLIQGSLLLSEDKTGQPVALMDAKWITGERTAAASALIAREQSRPKSTTLGIIGCGLQARKHLLALTQVVPSLKQCLVYDIVENRMHEFISEMAPKFEIELIATSGPRDVTAAADIIVSGAPIVANPKPVIRPEWVKAGALGISIDYDASWRPETVKTFDIVLTDDKAQFQDEKNKGHFTGVDHIDADICELLTQGQGRRENNQQKILAYNLGIALEDLVVAAEAYRRAIKMGVGTLVHM